MYRNLWRCKYLAMLYNLWKINSYLCFKNEVLHYHKRCCLGTIPPRLISSVCLIPFCLTKCMYVSFRLKCSFKESNLVQSWCLTKYTVSHKCLEVDRLWLMWLLYIKSIMFGYFVNATWNLSQQSSRKHAERWHSNLKKLAREEVWASYNWITLLATGSLPVRRRKYRIQEKRLTTIREKYEASD